MQFIFDDQVYKAIKVSGPKHNMLGLVFTDEDKHTDVEVIALKSDVKGPLITSYDVKQQVLAGINEINSEYGVNYKVKQIQFVPSDTPSNEIYKELTMEIVKRLIAGFSGWN